MRENPLEPAPYQALNRLWGWKGDEDARNRELFEESVAIIKTAWANDTFSFKGKYWTYPPEGQRQPHPHPVYLKYGRGVDPDGTIREVGIAPRPLQNPIPVYSGFTHSLQTSLYWAREGGKPIVMASEMALPSSSSDRASRARSLR